MSTTGRVGLLRSTAVFSAMTFLSRISGLVRDQVYAGVFGASAAMDAFVVAFRIPNFLRRLSAEGSFSMAFSTFLTEVRSIERWAALRALRTTACLARFLEDLMLATEDPGNL